MRAVVMLMAAIGLPGCASSADFVMLDQPIAKVYEVKADKVRIFNVSRQWVAENFRSARAVVEYEDKDAGTLIGNGSIPYPCVDVSSWNCATLRQSVTLQFTMRLDSKDDRFRLEFTNLRVKSEYGEIGQIRRNDLPAAQEALQAFGDQIVGRIADQKKSAEW
jgi:hypothetical protein